VLGPASFNSSVVDRGTLIHGYEQVPDKKRDEGKEEREKKEGRERLGN